MSEVYTRRGSASLKKETTANTAVIPDTFFELNSEDISTEYAHTPTTPVAGVRSKAYNIVKNKIGAPQGTISLNIEPNTAGHFFNGMFGGVTTGNYVKVSTVSGTFNTAGLVTFVGSSATATPVYVGKTFILFSTFSGTPLVTDTLSQAGSGATANVDLVDATEAVKGHAAKAPAELEETYSLQMNYADSAMRYIGVQFHGVDAIGQSDNVLSAGIKMMAQTVFRNTTCEAATAGSTVAVTADQTKGLVTGDIVKVFRPSTGAFIDLDGVGTKTTGATVTSATVATLATVTDNVVAGDLLMLAPQTASYTTADEYCWVGGGQVSIGDDLDTFVSEAVEEFSFVLDNEFEPRHSGGGNNFEDRYPSALLQKGLMGSGNFMFHYTDETFISALRTKSEKAIKINVEGSEIASTGINNVFQFQMPRIVLHPFETNLDVDNLIDTDIPFEAVHDDVTGYLAEILIVNNITSY
jgi:hypothetical protein